MVKQLCEKLLKLKFQNILSKVYKISSICQIFFWISFPVTCTEVLRVLLKTAYNFFGTFFGINKKLYFRNWIFGFFVRNFNSILSSNYKYNKKVNFGAGYILFANLISHIGRIFTYIIICLI